MEAKDTIGLHFTQKHFKILFLQMIGEKATKTKQKVGSFSVVYATERGLVEYYNVTKKCVVNTAIPSTDTEYSTLKFLLDVTHLLLLYGILHVYEFVPYRYEMDSKDWAVVNAYIVSKGISKPYAFTAR